MDEKRSEPHVVAFFQKTPKNWEAMMLWRQRLARYVSVCRRAAPDSRPLFFIYLFFYIRQQVKMMNPRPWRCLWSTASSFRLSRRQMDRAPSLTIIKKKKKKKEMLSHFLSQGLCNVVWRCAARCSVVPHVWVEPHKNKKEKKILWI